MVRSENLFAIRHGPAGSRHFAFAGHLDVVPPGEGWTGGAFVPEERAEMLQGRGAVDMKGAVAAMVASVAEVPVDAGTISFIITGDEEGPAVHGTRALIDFMAPLGEKPDLCLVGEPTSVARLGDMVKIGRRGSINVWLEVEGREGHVAYPHLADNPVPRLIRMLSELDALVLDEGTEWFQPSNLEITELEVGNPAHNVIPAKAVARISIRFNDQHTGARAGGADQRHRAKARRHRAPDHLGRAVPDAARRIFRAGAGGGGGGDGPDAGTVHQRRHFGCAVPAQPLPGHRVRPPQRDHAQARRGGGDRRSLHADANLCADCAGGPRQLIVIASEARQSRADRATPWIAAGLRPSQ